MSHIERALISVYNKTGIVDFARELSSRGVRIVSTGGTADLLKKNGIGVTEVAEITQFPEILDGRVKTLHPRVHAGLLAVRDNPEHVATLKSHAIETIDLLVVNLYPFAEALRKKVSDAEMIEMIDIGGPAMLRSAAKNHRFVAVVSDPADYGAVLQEMGKSGGSLSDPTRRRLAGKVFEKTAGYDALIASYFAAGTEKFQDFLNLSFVKHADLRYGENPHQAAVLYRDPNGSGIVAAKKLQGKELSFNNYLDLDSALEMVSRFEGPACGIVKHMNPCGFAVGKSAADAFRAAHRCDPLSAFGGIIGFNVPVDEKTAKLVVQSGFLECVVAPRYSKEALAVFSAKKNVRLLQAGGWKPFPHDYKQVSGGLLVQERDLREPQTGDLRTVTRKKATPAQIKDLLFAFRVSLFAKSNAIVIAKGGATVGLGMGQPSRVDSCLTAVRKAGPRAKGAVMASDGFFPKPDSIALAKKAGIRAIIQPGGSIQDADVIRACASVGIAMVFTGIRHFKH